MSIISTDIKLYNAANVPDDDTSIVGGAIDTGSEITGLSIGEFIPKQAIDAVSDTTWYYKFFIKNTSAFTYYDCSFYMENLLLTVVAAGTLTIVSESASDGSGFIARIKGIDHATGNEVTEDVTMNGLTPVTSVYQYDEVHRVEARSSVSPYALTGVNGQWTITRGIELGIIPYDGINDYYIASNELSFALAATVDDTGTTTNRLTAPGALVFTKPNTEGTALDCVGSGQDLAAGKAQGVWVKVENEAACYGSPDIQLVIVSTGSDS